jgi:hypothetical protein
MDTKLRKIANPTPEIAMGAMNSIPKTEDFIALKLLRFQNLQILNLRMD